MVSIAKLAKFLSDKPVLESGHTHDLKMIIPGDKPASIWVSRMTVGDYDGNRYQFNKDRVFVEIGGKTLSVVDYVPGYPTMEVPGCGWISLKK